MSPDEQLAVLTRNAVEVLPDGELEARLRVGRPLRVKLGLDPTAEHVTLGWAVVLRRLKAFQDLGHTAVLIVGDFTARIGDPSLQDKTRPMLSKDDVDAFADRLLDQFFLILDRDRTEVRRNSEWLEALGVEGFLELATHRTVAQTLQRDDFAQRLAANAPISLRELVYSLLQGYDSVAVESDVELGGTDQHFNLLVGRDLQRAYGQEQQVVLTMPLIVGTDGVRKMSQSLGNYVAITDPPEDMFGKLMRVPDDVLPAYLRLVADLPEEEAAGIERALARGDVRPEVVKRDMAEATVRLYHGAGAASAGREHFDRLFKEHRAPEDVPELPIPEACIADGIVGVPQLLRELGLAASASEGRRLIEQKGVRVDDQPITEPDVPVERLRNGLLQVGKRRFVKLR